MAYDIGACVRKLVGRMMRCDPVMTVVMNMISPAHTKALHRGQLPDVYVEAA